MHERPVETASGRVLGCSVSAEVRGFLGIPYAAPPIETLRWRPPQAPAAWSGTRDAFTFSADPIQPAGLRVSRAPTQSEDCLYLNVWAPKAHREGGWPVLVWSCGGAFTTGSGAFVEEDPARLAAKGAVVVSFNVRLNIFGFFAHAALSAESAHGASGNYGLMDQAAALRWVRDNIEAFNGDSRRITFFGESAGAALGLLLLASPIVERPFDRGIFQSPGSFNALLPLAEAERHGAPLGETVEELRAVAADDLPGRARGLEAVSPVVWRARPLRPIIDGWIIDVDDPLSSAAFRPVPAIIGTNEDEGLFFGPRMQVTTVEGFTAFAQGVYGDSAGEALALYPASNDADVPEAFAALYADRGFNAPISDLMHTFAKAGSPAYRYVYAYRHGESDRAPTHSEEIGVLLDNLPHLTSRDGTMAGIMASYWLGFAETGRPASAGLPDWPVFVRDTEPYLRLDVPPVAASRWRSTEAAFVRRALGPR